LAENEGLWGVGRRRGTLSAQQLSQKQKKLLELRRVEKESEGAKETQPRRKNLVSEQKVRGVISKGKVRARNAELERASEKWPLYFKRKCGVSIGA